MSMSETHSSIHLFRCSLKMHLIVNLVQSFQYSTDLSVL
jgi:hypothetical protein